MEDKNTLTRLIKMRARQIGFDLVAVTSPDYAEYADRFLRWIEQGSHGELAYMARNADRRTHLDQVLPGVRSVISVGLNYYSPDGEQAPQGDALTGRIARYALNRDYHTLFQTKLKTLVDGIYHLAPASQTKIYVDTGPILEKALAQRAGMGWIGKSTNLISDHIGSWFFIGEVLTDVELDFDEPHVNRCGTCHRCIDVCPTQAIVAPYELDARRCIAYLTIEVKGEIPIEMRPLIGNRIYGCDDCQDVCPWNRFATQTHEYAFLPRQDLKAPALTELMQLTEEEFLHRFRHSPIKRIKRRGLLRNVAVALGNSKDPRAVPALSRALTDNEPLIRAHAAWALGQIGGDPAAKALRERLTRLRLRPTSM